MAVDAKPIDAHVHVASSDRLRFPISQTFPRAPKFDAPVESLLADMEATAVAQSLLIQPSLYGFDHAYLLESLRAHSERFLGMALANPADESFAVRLAEMTRAAAITGVRFAPLIDADLPWFTADHLASVIADLDLVVGLLIGPAHFEQAISWITRWPQIRVVIDHVGRPDLGENPTVLCESVARLADLPNVWVKLSALSELSREPYPHRDTGAWARRMLTAFGPERLMWGTDFPFVAGPAYAASLASLRDVLGAIEPSAWRRIVGGTAAEVFRFASLN
jgi:L-fuconolactonase